MNTPEPAAPYRTLPAAQGGDPTAALRWLLTDLFLVGGAGILGGAPKTGKSFFALDLAVAVASATPAVGRFAVAAPGPVLLCAAEDPPAVVVQRLAALAAGRDQALATLPVAVIVEPGGACPTAWTGWPPPSRRRRLACSSSIRSSAYTAPMRTPPQRWPSPRRPAHPGPRHELRHPARASHPQGLRRRRRRPRPARLQ
jgi:AAA domain